MPYPNRWVRRFNFTRNKASGVVFDESNIDTELNDGVTVVQQLNDRLRGITNADGTLRPFTPPAAMDLLSLTRFSATSGQTLFTVGTYNTTTDVVVAWSGGGLIDPSSVTKTSTTSVTLPSQSTGAVVTILIFTSGSGLLTNLADAVTVGEGASLVGVRDAGGLYTATTVEDALAEVATGLATLLTSLGVISNYIKKDGTVTFAANQAMGGFKITGLGAATANGHAVRWEQLQAVIAQITGITAAFLPKTGGTMTGAIDMGSNLIHGVTTPVVAADAANKSYVDAQLASFGGLPVASVVPYAGTIMPSGWLDCSNGTAVSRTTYANLYAAIGVTYGTGDGATTFNLPNIAGRVLLGMGTGSGLTTRSLADVGGEETHVLSVAELPAHTHAQGFLNTGTSGGGAGTSFGTANNTGSTGANTGHNNIQPFLVLRYIIKT